MKIITVAQCLADVGLKRAEDGSLQRLDGGRIKHHFAFKDWQYRLKCGERLPRGRFFRGKKPGRPLFIMDEPGMLFNGFSQ